MRDRGSDCAAAPTATPPAATGSVSASALAQGLETIFAGELEEQLRAAVDTLPRLSSSDGRAAACRQLARIFHTIKGGAGLVGRADLAEAAEAFECFFSDPLGVPVPGQDAMDRLCAAAALEAPRIEMAITDLRGQVAPSRHDAAAAGAAARDDGVARVPFSRLESLLRAVTHLVVGQIQIEDRARALRRVSDRLLHERQRLFEWAARPDRPASGAAQAARGVGERADEVRDLSEALAEQAAGLVRRASWLRRELGTLWPAPRTACEPVERVVIMECGTQVLALPFSSVDGAAALPASAVREAAERGVLAVDGTVAPVLVLGRLIGEPLPVDHAIGITVSDREQRAVLVVDRLRLDQDLAVQPLHRLLASHPLIRAAAIAASGQVIVLLDAARLVRAASDIRSLLPRHGPPEGSGEGRTPVPRAVLVVDDSETVRRFIGDILAGAGLDFDCAADGQEALEKLAAGSFQLVLTDIEMPRMDGFELIAALRRDPRWRDQPVLVCTSRSREHHRVRIDALGVSGCVTKPFTREQLVGDVRRALGAGANAVLVPA